MSEVDEMFDELLRSNNTMEKEDSGALQEYINKAREAETKAKVQIYTMKGKKSLEILKQMEEEEEEESTETDSYTNSSQLDELRRQIEHYKELERIEKENIERLKKERELQQLFHTIDNQQVETTRSTVEEINIPSVSTSSSDTSPNFLHEPAPIPQVIQPPVVVEQPVIIPPVVQSPPQPTSSSSSSSLQPLVLPQSSPSLQSSSSASSADLLLSPRSRKGRAPETPSGYLVKVLSIQWDNAPKSKKNNKIYTISFTMFGRSWKVVRSDENLVEFSKRMLKSKAEGTPIPLLTKKSIKKDQQQELISQLDAYFNSINLTTVFKREKPRTIFLKFVGPSSVRDEGYGSIQGTDYEGWYVSHMGLQK